MPTWSGKLHKIIGSCAYVLAQDYEVNGCVVKRYMPIASYDDLLVAVQSYPHAYEVLLDEQARVYFDIDCKRDKDDDISVLNHACSMIKQIMDSHGIHVKRKHMRILSACTATKISYHVILCDVAFKDASSRKAFGRSLRKEVPSHLDPAPYASNCLFRCPGSSKLGKHNALCPVDRRGTIITDYAIEEYMVHARSECEHVLSLKAHAPIHALERPACAAEHVLDCLRSHGDTTSVFDHYRSQPVPSFYFKSAGPRKCLSGSGEVHTRNNFIVYCGPDGTLVYKCFAPACTRQAIIGSYDVPMSTTVPPDTTYTDARCRPYVIHTGGKVQIIQSEMGTGKTYQIRQMLKENASMRTLIICFRVELGQYMYTYLENMDFVFYKNTTGTLSCDRLICQVNSMHRIYNATYDLLILDEVESIMEQFNGVCATRRRMCWLVLEKLIRDTPHVFALDAGIADRSLEVLHSIRKDMVVIRNLFQGRSQMKLMETNNRLFFSRLIGEITANRAIAITSTSASLLVSLKGSLSRLFPAKNIVLIWSQSSDVDKRMYARDLSHVDVFMYSATLQAGISIDIKHFSKLFVYATANGPTPQSLHQMLARIRHFHDNEIYITFDKGSTSGDCGEEWSYDQMVGHLTTPVDMALDSRFSADMSAVISGFAKDWSRVYSCTPFFVCTVHNILQSFNGTRHFRKLFMRQALSKGYDVTTITDCWDMDAQASDLLKMTRTEMKLQKEEYYQAIAHSDTHTANVDECKKDVDASNILLYAAHEALAQVAIGTAAYDQNLSDLAEKQRAASEKEKLLRQAERGGDACMQKSVLARFYGVAPERVTVAFLTKCEPLSARDAFLRLCLTTPRYDVTCDSVQQRITEVIRCEGSHLTSNGIMYCVENLARSTNGIKLALCHQLLNDIGFQHIFDTATIVIDFESACVSINRHKGQIASAMELREAATISTLKELIKFCNSVLYRCYKTRVVCCKKRHMLRRFSAFPPHRFVEVSTSVRPALLSDSTLAQAKLRVQ